MISLLELAIFYLVGFFKPKHAFFSFPILSASLFTFFFNWKNTKVRNEPKNSWIKCMFYETMKSSLISLGSQL
jgi:hypothetical protein